MRRLLMSLLFSLMLLPSGTPLLASGNWPFDLQVRNASTGTSLATPTYDIATKTATNVLQTIPVDLCVTSGFQASITVSITTATAVITPALPAGTRKIQVTSTADMNVGGSDVGTGAGPYFITGGSAGILVTISSLTPGIYFRGRTANGTVYILPYKE